MRTLVRQLETELESIPGAKELFPDLWLLPGRTDSNDLAASSLLFAQSQPLLVDAGMAIETASALRASGLVKRLHLTHLHLDHRSRQDWFVGDDVTCPAVERSFFVDWGAFLAASGFKGAAGFDFHRWRETKFHVNLIPHIRGLEAGQPIAADDIETRLLLLPGHTSGHSGLLLPQFRAALVTDYDMEPFGPWYGNPISDLTAYEENLIALMQRDDIDWFITSHQRGMLDRDEFCREAQRYLEIIERRTQALLDTLADRQPHATRNLVGKGVFYSQKAFGRNPVFAIFEARMTQMHLQRSVRLGHVRKTDAGWQLAI